MLWKHKKHYVPGQGDGGSTDRTMNVYRIRLNSPIHPSIHLKTAKHQKCIGINKQAFQHHGGYTSGQSEIPHE